MRKLLTLATAALAAILFAVPPAFAADTVINVCKGRAVEFMNRVDNNDPTNSAFVVLLLKVAEGDTTLEDYDTLSALLGGSNTEADFTNYVRKTFTDSDVTFEAPDDTNDRYDADLPDITWTGAGGASNNTLVKLLVGYDDDSTGGTDANIIPCVALDFAATTDGNDLTATIADFIRAN